MVVVMEMEFSMFKMHNEFIEIEHDSTIDDNYQLRITRSPYAECVAYDFKSNPGNPILHHSGCGPTFYGWINGNSASHSCEPDGTGCGTEGYDNGDGSM